MLQSMMRISIAMIFVTSCKMYKQDLMFQLDDNFTESDLSVAVQEAEKNYIIQKNDYLRLDVFTNGGERIIDPNFELIQQGGGAANQRNQQREFQYLVQENGTVKLPIIGVVNLDGMTIIEAESKLEQLYNQYYKGTFVKLQFTNKRVVILGATGGQVIPLPNENTSLLEALALSGGLPANGRAQNIMLIRGEYKNQEIYRINLSKVSTMKESLLTLKPGDVIYIEPWKRPVREGLRDVSPFLSVISSLLTLYLVIQNI